MKAGILTFHLADNYGAVLQAYALRQVLLKFGVASEILTTDFSNGSYEERNCFSGAAAVLKKRILSENEKRHRLFEEFREGYLRCSPKYEDRELEKANPLYDFFIAGSDQVWNLRIPGTSGRYFLPFADPEKRVSYAASFGSEEIPEKSRAWCRDQLKSFAYLSVREKSARDLIQRLTGRRADVVLDPVLLLTRGEWDGLYERKDPPPYYLLYMITYDGELAMRAKQAACKDGVSLRTVCGTFMPQFGFEAWSGVSVKEWLGLIAGASRVFTNSFHGLAFSLLYELPVEITGLKGALSGRNGRMEELLAVFGVRFASDYAVCSLPEGAFEEKMAPYKEASLRYLMEVREYAENLQHGC